MRDDELTMAFFLTGEMSEELEELIQLENEERYIRRCDAQKKSKRGERRHTTYTKCAKDRNKFLNIWYDKSNAPCLGKFKKEGGANRDASFRGDIAYERALKKASRRAAKQDITEQLEEYLFAERELTLAENSWSDSDLEMLLNWEEDNQKDKLRDEFHHLVEHFLMIQDMAAL